jgi:predicted Zn-dependent protease
MPDPIDDLSQRWKRNPDAATTIALCEALRLSPRPTLVQQVGELATRRHSGQVPVLLAVARMYLDTERLSDAQAVLVTAGKVAPREGGVYRWLGEVLLRRGDADRAEKVLERAAQLGSQEPDTALWLERARSFKVVQAKKGIAAVAAEIAAAGRSRLPRLLFDADEGPTKVRSAPVDATSGGTDFERKFPTAVETAPLAMLVQDVQNQVDHALTLSTDEVSEDALMPAQPAAAKPSVAVLPPRGTLSFSAPPAAPKPSSPAPSLRPPPPQNSPMPRARPAPSLTPSPAVTPPPAAASFPPVRPPPSTRREAGLAPAADAQRVVPSAEPWARGVASPAAPGSVTGGPPGAPVARDVLRALALAGAFEPDGTTGAGAFRWDRPTEKVRRRSGVVLGTTMAVLIGAGVGAFKYVSDQRQKAHIQAEAILQTVEADLLASRVALLPDVEVRMGHAFELDSRSQRAAIDWLHERALLGIMKGSADVAFEGAIARATEVDVPEAGIAFARVAAYLFQGDTAGAAGLMNKWDGPAANDAWYQLMTGATLERAGDPRAAERYATAVRIEPNLVIAQILLTQATAIDGDPGKALDFAKQFRAKYPDRSEGGALLALAWARDPARGEQAPAEIADLGAHSADLPLPLAAVPYAIAAIAANDKQKPEDAKGEIVKGLALADGPGIASWLGSVALDTRDEALVQKAALVAVGFSAVYPPARVLAARVALLGGRFDQALKATEDMDPSSPDVAVVHAATAYERLDVDGLGRALDALSADARKLPFMSALVLAPDALSGRASGTSGAKILEMSSDDAPWSDLLAMDLALDLGELEVADKIAARWKGSEDKPLRALRLSRLARYQNKVDVADALSKTALESGTVTPRTLEERVFVLVAKNKATEVAPLLARYPLVLGPSATWLGAYALASANRIPEALGRIASIDPPPPQAPLPARVIAAVALASVKDKRRASDYARALLRSGVGDPDLVAAAVSLGFHRVERAKHRATYE